MADPATLDAYNALYLANNRVEGVGADVTMCFPCAFCAAPDWYVVKLVNFAQNSPRLRCASCRRVGRVVYSSDESSSAMRIVQIEGAPPPAYLESLIGREVE